MRCPGKPTAYLSSAFAASPGKVDPLIERRFCVTQEGRPHIEVQETGSGNLSRVRVQGRERHRLENFGVDALFGEIVCRSLAKNLVANINFLAFSYLTAFLHLPDFH